MSTSKRFKRKMNKPRVGHSYWRIHGLPIPKYNFTPEELEAYCKQNFADSVVLDHLIFYSEQEFITTNPPSLNGTMVRYHKTRKSAQKFLAEVKDGLHMSDVWEMESFHRELDMIRLDDF